MENNDVVTSKSDEKNLKREEKKRQRLQKKEQRHVKHNVGDICPLSHLKVGQIGKIVTITNDNKCLRRRLFDMGLTVGVTVEVKRISPLGDPVDVIIRGYDLCLRKQDMDNIEVEVIS